MLSIRASRRRSLPLVAAVLLVVLMPLVSRADSVYPPTTGPFTLTVTAGSTTYTYEPTGSFPNATGPTIEVADGTPLTVEVSGDSFARLQARQCTGTSSVSNSAEFNPDFFNLCTSATLGAGEPGGFRDSGPVAPGTSEITIPFAVGAGVAPELESQITGEINPGFTCGPGNDCQLVVRVEVSGGVGSSNFLSFPLSFGPAETVPSAPTAVTAAPGNGEATVSWSVPVSNGGAAITGYTVTASPGGGSCVWVAGPLSCVVAGLVERHRLHVHGDGDELGGYRPAVGTVERGHAVRARRRNRPIRAAQRDGHRRQR